MKATSPSAGAFVLFALLSAWTARAQEASPPAAFQGTENLASMIGGLDISCILKTWRIVGVMTCPAPPAGVNVCVIVENAYPVGILEAVRRPLASHLVEANLFMKPLGPLPAFGKTSSFSPSAADGTGLEFSEGHAYEFVPSVPLAGGLPLVVPRGRLFAVSYLSELDGYFWRTGLAEMLLDPAGAAKKVLLPSCGVVPRTDDCAWTWGSWFPRIGFTVHPSEVMAAHLQALRAGRVGANPIGRVVESAYPYEPRTGHYMQMVRPTRRGCMPIGFPATRTLEAGALSREGAYLFVHFGIFRACKGCLPPTLAEPRVPSL